MQQTFIQLKYVPMHQQNFDYPQKLVMVIPVPLFSSVHVVTIYFIPAKTRIESSLLLNIYCHRQRCHTPTSNSSCIFDSTWLFRSLGNCALFVLMCTGTPIRLSTRISDSDWLTVVMCNLKSCKCILYYMYKW